MKITTKQEAKKLGLPRYFTGKPCKRGHLAERIISGNCTECARLIHAQWCKDNQEHRQTVARHRYASDASVIKARSSARYRAKTHEIRAQQKQYRKLNASAVKQRKRTYALQNSAKLVAKATRWREANLERDSLRRRQLYWKDPETHRMKHRLISHKRRSLLKGELSADIAQKLLQKQDWRCACPCHQLLHAGYHIDHIIPISRGGPNIDSNVQLLTPNCNARKSNKNNEVFMAQQRKKYANT